MCETTVCPGVAEIYTRFQWLEKVCPQAKIDCAYVRDLKDVGVVSNASAYLVQADGAFSEISLRVTCKPLWPNTVFVDSKTVENLEEDILCANQTVSAAYAVLIQHSGRCVTIFELENV